MQTETEMLTWLDKYVAEQRKQHGSILYDLIREVAEGLEWYGDDELETYTRQPYERRK